MNVHEGFDGSLHGQRQASSLGIVADNLCVFLDFALITSEFHLQGDFSLAAGRDCLVKPGNGATSAGADFFDLEYRLPCVFDNKIM